MGIEEAAKRERLLRDKQESNAPVGVKEDKPDTRPDDRSEVAGATNTV